MPTIFRLICILLCGAISFLFPLATYSQEYVLVGWNDLGMHCSNKGFSKVVVLPPFNNVTAQLILKIPNQPPKLVDSGYTIEYYIPNNTYSVGKTDFWTYAQQLFGLPNPLPANIGLTGKGLTGTLDSGGSFFSARGIPVTPFPDSDLVHESPFQLIHLDAKSKADGRILTSTEVVIPVSNEVGCVQSGCHSSETSILNSHESVTGFNRNGPVLCASCHASNALGTTGSSEAGAFSYRMHSKHKDVAGARNDINTCYKCHPGPKTQCLRDIMGKNPTNPLVCQNCHGAMDSVARSISAGRRPWLDEPKCGTCHGAAYAEEPGKLFRQSRGHGGLFCSACHGSPHAIQPTVQANDNLQNIRLQGFAGTLRKCSVCHTTSPNGPGPHGIMDTTVVSVAPAAPVLVFPVNGSIGVAINPLLSWNTVPIAPLYALQVSTDSQFSTIVLNDSSLTQSSKAISILSSNQEYFWRVRAKNQIGSSDWSQVWKFVTGTSSQVTFAVQNRWNLASLPVRVSNPGIGNLFPTAFSLAFQYTQNVGYEGKDTLTVGRGYWLKFSNAQSINLIGTPAFSETIAVQVGWNLIGSISSPIPTSSIISDPPGIITTDFFGYNNGYLRTDIISPGQGYWVRVQQQGTLILSSNVQSRTFGRIMIVPTSELPPSQPGDIKSAVRKIPDEYALIESYPNPFNPATTISYTLPVESKVIIRVYDLLGQVVATLVDEEENEGYKTVVWNAGNATSGIYLCRIEAISVTDPQIKYSHVKKMLLLK